MLKKYLSVVFIGAATIGTGTQATTASAVTCVTNSLPSFEVPCGVARGRASYFAANTFVNYAIRSTTGALVSGVPVRANGSTLIPEQADTGGGTCNTISASSGLGLFRQRDCHMVITSDAKRYFMQG